jgi:hypothetical protein
VPSDLLDALDSIPTEQVPWAITRLSARLLVPQPADDLLSVADAAALLHKSARWVLAHADELGASRLSRKNILFSKRTLIARIQRKARRT